MKFRRPTSLTTRLGLMFALAATLTFAGGGGYLYRSLALQLEARDDSELVGKIGLIRHLLQETPSVQTLRNDTHRFVDVIAEHDGLILVLKSADGTTLLESRPMQGVWPEISVTPADKVPDKDALRQWMLSPGSPTRAVAAWGVLGNGKEQVQIVIARTASDRMALLTEYRRDVLAAVLLGALVAAFLGYMLTRRALQPVRAIAGQAQSITAQRLDMRLNASEAPDELQTLVESFNAMLDRLHESFQRLSQFSGDMAHDMRTPINNLMLQTQVALSQTRSVEDYHALLESNVEEYERLSRMVESMLFLARADHAQIALDTLPLDAAVELQRIADYFEGIAEEAGVKIAVHASGTITADAVLFRRAVNNLVANAIRYTPTGQSVQLEACAASDAAAVTVSNPGPGIDPRDVPWLFDRFYRVDRARSDSASSAGLGLAIVQSIMTLHGGCAEVESKGGVTSFRLLFPIVTPNNSANKASQMKTAAGYLAIRTSLTENDERTG